MHYFREVPTTYDELLDLAAKINEQGIVPLAMDGGDGWPMAVYLSDILYKLAGYDYSTIVSDAISSGDFSNENISALKQMETVYLLTNGGSGNSTQFAANYLYQQAFKAFKYGYGNAIGVVFIIICLVTTVVLNTIFADREDKPAKAKKKEGGIMEHAGKKNSKAKKPLLWIVLLIMAVIQIFPLVWLVDFSLVSSNEMFTNGLLIIPEKIQWGNYVKAFVDGHFLLYLKNSVLINGLVVLLVILVSIMASFACRRMNWKLRIERACTYLEQNYLKTYEIAYRVGFRDEKYFSRVFKKVKGMSPKEYRTGNSQEPA